MAAVKNNTFTVSHLPSPMLSILCFTLFTIPAEFIVFGLTLLAIAVFHKRSLEAALGGLAIIIILKYAGGHFSFFEHITGNMHHEGEWKILLNLFGLLTGFAVLSSHFETSGVPQHLPRFMPDDWKGGFVLLVMVFILSSFLDNIAAAMIGGAVAHVVFKKKVHIGFIAAIVAASNAGGAGSVLGDTTTTMMWIEGVSPLNVLHAYVASAVAFLFFSIIASIQQDRYNRILKDEIRRYKIDGRKILIVVLMLAGVMLTNIVFDFPAVGLWAVVVFSHFIRKVPMKEIKSSLKGSFFLISLVLIASLMPVQYLPEPSWHSTFSLGFLSSVFDNIPLTKLALVQGGYDWGMLAYAVGFGGSMVWFGSSAGVAITNIYPEGRSVFQWLKGGWHIIIAYVLGFFALYGLMGWNA
jgi:Na+/H+ antiporter NhaD/arsenite permease-like protein